MHFLIILSDILKTHFPFSETPISYQFWYLNYVCHLGSFCLFWYFPNIPSSVHSCFILKLHILLYRVYLKRVIDFSITSYFSCLCSLLMCDWRFWISFSLPSSLWTVIRLISFLLTWRLSIILFLTVNCKKN